MIKILKFLLAIELSLIIVSLFGCDIYKHEHDWMLVSVAGEFDDTYEMGTEIYRCQKDGEIKIEEANDKLITTYNLSNFLHLERGSLGKLEQYSPNEIYKGSYKVYSRIYGTSSTDRNSNKGSYINVNYKLDKEYSDLMFEFLFGQLLPDDYFEIRLTLESKNLDKSIVLTFFFLMDEGGYYVYMFLHAEYDQYGDLDYFNKTLLAKRTTDLIDCVRSGKNSPYYSNFTEQEIARAKKFIRRRSDRDLGEREEKTNIKLSNGYKAQYVTIPIESYCPEIKIDESFYLYDSITRIEFANISNYIPLETISFS